MSKTWFVSDLHFGHANVIPYCDRPYAGIEEMTTAIVKVWNETVKPEDTVYVLGDFSLNPRWAYNLGPILNGTKHLISGNHDACFDFPNRISAMNKKEKYEAAGWTVKMEDWITLPNSNYTVKLSHFPFAGGIGDEYDTRYMDYRTPHTEEHFLLHGHLHGRYRKYKNMIDVGFDGDLKLWSSDEIVALIQDERSYIETPISEHYRLRDANGQNNSVANPS